MLRARQPFPFGLTMALVGFLVSVQPSVGDVHELTILGFPEESGRDEVEAYCSACHSLKLVIQQGLSRQDWDELMVWMVEEQEMEEIEAQDRMLVLDYLAKFISIEAAQKRRKNQRKPGFVLQPAG
ncbi:MAG: hypothetical protein ACTSY1_00650 [Alphaproteobacteria bacterium]